MKIYILQDTVCIKLKGSFFCHSAY